MSGQPEETTTFANQSATQGTSSKVLRSVTWDYGGVETQLVRRLGKGAEGAVYAAVMQMPQGPVERAIKVAHSPGENPKFAHEAEFMAPYRGQVRNAIIPEGPFPLMHPTGTYYAATHMPRVPGVSLDVAFPKAQLKASPSETAGILAQVAQTLHDCEKAGITHRDIKPGNLMYVPQAKKVRVIDWGMADNGQDPGTYGTPMYMSPEVARGEAATGRSDVYSLGMTAASLVEGTSAPRHFPPRSIKNQAESIKWAGEYTGLPQVNDQYMRMVVHRACNPDPEKRSSPIDLMANLAAYPEARQHFSPADSEAIADHLVRRASNVQTRHALLDANAARGVQQMLPEDHRLQKNLAAITKLGPELVPQDRVEPQAKEDNDASAAPQRRTNILPVFNSTMRR